MTSFSISIENPELKDKLLSFHLIGNDEYGLDKSIINSLRRTLLSEIPSIAFRINEEQPKDIIMEVNNTSLHNEFIMHRLSMIPLYIDPKSYEKQYLFYLNVKHDGSEPFKFITSDDIQIFPLKNEEPSNEISLDDYDMNKPLSKKEHDEILPKFKFRGKEYPILISELKSTNVKDNYQELICYGVPSLSDAREHASWKAVSDATYTFLPNEELFTKIANDKASLKKLIDDDEREEFINELRVSEYERYFFRDVNNEPNKYTFSIYSLHYYENAELFKLSCEIMINKLELLKQHFINLVKGGTTSIIYEPSINENNYIIKLCGQNDTIGNVLQSHIVNHHMEDDSILGFCGYKKSHPLEEHVNLFIGLNPNNDVYNQSEEFKLNAIVKYMDDLIEDLISIYRDIQTEATKTL